MKNLKVSFFHLLLVLTITGMLSGCYRMPGDDDYSLVPATNNPDVVGERGSQDLMPGSGF